MTFYSGEIKDYLLSDFKLIPLKFVMCKNQLRLSAICQKYIVEDGGIAEEYPLDVE